VLHKGVKRVLHFQQGCQQDPSFSTGVSHVVGELVDALRRRRRRQPRLGLRLHQPRLKAVDTGSLAELIFTNQKTNKGDFEI
jgi:hypothetical protein